MSNDVRPREVCIKSAAVQMSLRALIESLIDQGVSSDQLAKALRQGLDKCEDITTTAPKSKTNSRDFGRAKKFYSLASEVQVATYRARVNSIQAVQSAQAENLNQATALQSEIASMGFRSKSVALPNPVETSPVKVVPAAKEVDLLKPAPTFVEYQRIFNAMPYLGCQGVPPTELVLGRDDVVTTINGHTQTKHHNCRHIVADSSNSIKEAELGDMGGLRIKGKGNQWIHYFEEYSNLVGTGVRFWEQVHGNSKTNIDYYTFLSPTGPEHVKTLAELKAKVLTYARQLKLVS